LDQGGGERRAHLSFSQRETNNFKIFQARKKNRKLQPQSPPAAIGGDQDAKKKRGRKKLFKLFDDKKMNYFVSLGAREQEVIFPFYFSSSPADIVRHYENYTRLNWRAKRQRPRHLSRRSSLSQNNYHLNKTGRPRSSGGLTGRN
jgi:hypothetical protein